MKHMPTLALHDGLPQPARFKAMIAVLVAVTMASLDTAIVNTALPTIASDIGASNADSIWVVNAYHLVMVAALLPMAALGEIVGQNRTFLVGLAVFTVTSLLCGLSWSLPTLVAARAAQGLGAAAIMSVNVALIRFISPSAILGRSLGLNALVVAVAFTLGPTVASAILWASNWQWLFLINVPAGLLAFALSSQTLPKIDGHARQFDPLAAILCAGFLGLTIFGLSTFAHGGDWAGAGLQWGGAALCCVVLMRREAGRSAPILAVDLFLLPAFALSAITSTCSFMVQGLAFVSLPFLLQTEMGLSQVKTGLLITPWPAVVAIMAPIAGRLSDRYPAGILGSIGLAMLCAGMASLALMPADPDIGNIIWRMVLCGAGFGFFQSPNLRAMMTSAPVNRSGAASGLVATARLMGQSIGAALVALCLTISPLKGTLVALWLGCAVAAIGGVASLARLRYSARG
jgi:DHA2 family multidrug resistance protein-like MFS transporter